MRGFTKLIYMGAIAAFLSGCASDNPIYRGEVRDGKPQGHGWKVWPSGEKYDGNWSNGEMSGKGVFTWPVGNRYEGEFSNGLRDGQGTMIYADRSRYDGEWRDGVRSGKGVMTFANQDRYEGTWANDEPSGTGAQVFKNGNMYIGRFVAGKRDGDGAALAYWYPEDSRWCIEECVDSSSQYAIVAGVFSPIAENQAVTATPCGFNQNNCQPLVAPALVAFQQWKARKLVEAEQQRVLMLAKAEKERAAKEAALLAEKKRLAEERHRFLHETGTAAQVYMDADALETNRDYVQASEVYRIVVTRFPESTFAANAMLRLGAMRDKRDQQEAEAKKAAADIEARNRDENLRKEDIAARKAEAEARKSEAEAAQAAAQTAAQNNRNQGGGGGRSLACIACDQLDGLAKSVCKATTCN